MGFVRSLRSLALLAALSLASACDNGPTDPSVFDPVGSLSFTYSGAVSGTFQVSGALAPTAGGATFQPVTGATAIREGGLLSLVGTRTASAGRVDLFSVLLGGVTSPGTVQLDPLACQQQDLSTCRIAVFALDIEPPSDVGGPIDPAPYLDRMYVLLQGNVTVTSFTSTRIKGTFAGTALRASSESLGGLVLISNGTFDLPVQPQP